MIKNHLKSNAYKNHADFSKKFLIFGISLLIVFFEIALAKWSLFFGAAPMLSLCYIFTLLLVCPQLMSPITVILPSLLFEVMGGDMLGVRMTAFYIVALLVTTRLVSNEHDDFISYWANFSLICIGVVLFRLLVFIFLYFTMPNIFMLAFQIGVSIVLFPVFFVSTTILLSMAESPIKQID